jgi:hypothetical protein
MGLLDMLFGDQDKERQPQAAPVDPNAINPIYGVPEALIQEMKKEQERADKAGAWANLFGGAANIARGVQGGPPIYDPSSSVMDPNAAMDGLAKRVMMFSQLREGFAKQQSTAELKRAIMADPNLTPAQKQAALVDPTIYKNYIENQLKPSEIDVRFDSDNRPVAAWDKTRNVMLPPDEAAKRGIQLASGMAPSKAMDIEDSLRKEARGALEVSRYAEADPVYRSMVNNASVDTGAADLDLVYGIGKILDPNSVVREGEMVMVNKTSPFAEMLQGYVNSISGQGKLTAETRSRLLEMARGRMGELRSAYDEVIGGVTSRAKERGIDPSRVKTREYAPLPDAPIYSANARGFIPQQAIADLRSNPTPAEMAEFDIAFGQGAARRALGGR